MKRKIINADKEFVLYTDGSSERMTESKLNEVLKYALQERVFYARYIIELEKELEQTTDTARIEVLNDLIFRADQEFTRYYNISDKLTR